MKHNYECVSSDSFKNKQYFGKGELITITVLVFVVIAVLVWLIS